MEIKTCEEYVLKELKNSKEEINSLKKELEELQRSIVEETEKRIEIEKFISLFKEYANPMLKGTEDHHPYVSSEGYFSEYQNKELFNLLIKYFNLEEERNEELDGK